MDIFDRQREMMRSSRQLLLWYILIASILAVSLGGTAVVLVSYAQWSRPAFHAQPQHYAWAFAIGALAALLSLVVTTCIEFRRLRQGIEPLLTRLGGRRIVAAEAHPAERRVLNVVEEMALAANIPVPSIFVLVDEPGINSCALASHSLDVAICVTQGCLYRLSRSELQAVIAHSISDVLHRDLMFRLRMVALIGGLQSVSTVGLYLIYPRWRAKGQTSFNPLFLPFYPLSVVIGVDLLITGSLGYLCGELLGGAVARRRTLLGDAAACQYTRDPGSLVAALAKVGGFVLGSRLLAPGLVPFRHLFFCRVTYPALPIFDSHPDLIQRILAIDPSWDRLFRSSRINAWLAEGSVEAAALRPNDLDGVSPPAG